MKRKLLAVIFLGVFLASVLSGCVGGGKTGGDDTIKIGGLAPLTGNVAIYGTAASNGAKLYIDEVNKAGGLLGKQIEYIEYDEKGDPVEAVNAYNKLMSQKVVAIIGDVTSKPAISVAAKAAVDGIPMIAPTATAAEVTEAGENVFRACFLDPVQGEAMAEFAKENLSVKTAAVIYNNADDYSTGVAKAFEEGAKARDIKVEAVESYGAADKDFKAQLTNIAQKKVDVLFIPDYYNTIALIATQAKEVGLEATLLGADGWDGVLDALDANNLDVVEGSYFCNHYSVEDQDPMVQDFLVNYKNKYGDTPNSFAALGYDAAKILIAAIEKAGNTDFAAVVAALSATDIKAVTSQIQFDENRNPMKDVSVIKIEEGAYKFSAKIKP